ncbi:Lipoate-protein ligase B (LipB) (PDB:2QHT) (PUBMED:19798051) [Commensalibacter communis]|uniref:lipoyl(octanoyl) transferase LipB n=1 Tax=Commensalibacter communis TaxID=2972786 RepID=UPI0022FF7C86|nr:lipoyl(octanoyl) transferase LipB [Commensalibacter communis]CAI3956892.1 Lipoate-protein ligase B (LipB) (PDB:2QHT) (PUBMED:19798051) [Commensalibacter communis]CAI3957901.1 Lipoate-protein ligase B (LipB) (PDB:2QHT) (PUBMED:19798051) [Commensalibacter communis]CAI3958523.1 Lipoate-protein ligase B (LipB) (PDB:2QHT) (PUBMED:19798051) [Commensalibacter communis]
MAFHPIFIQKSKKLVSYPNAIQHMERYVQDIYNEKQPECLWFLEHPPLYTAGTSAKDYDLINTQNYPTFYTNRGGQWTYHGPGQRIIYIMMDLRKDHQAFPSRDIHAFVNAIEDWVILTLRQFNIYAEKRKDRIGLWVINPITKKEEKIAALGIKLTRWISWHGIALNISPNLNDYTGIVPCGLAEFGVTSMEKLGVKCSMDEVDQVLLEQWNHIFPYSLQEKNLFT